MGQERSLLERIAGGGRLVGRRDGGEDVAVLLDSVRKRLTALLNSRSGMSEAQPDYGLPAMVDVAVESANYVQDVQNAIKATIEKYEPRLCRVRVTHLAERSEENKGRKLVFRIEGVLAGRDERDRVVYQTAMTSGGRFDVAD